MNPVRIQRSRQKKQVSPNGLPVVYVGRPTKFGNPFKKKGKEDVIGWYSNFIKYRLSEEVIIRDLKGKNLSCWCKISEPCHADILLKIANQ